MCGLVGFFSSRVSEASDSFLINMATAIRHRGPDDSGYWRDDFAGIALGHRRLSILDLSPAGHQPMFSFCGRFVLVFNGEVYNHLQLRTELENRGDTFSWQGHSDTETLLACFSVWGVERTLEAAVGMFAIALWDRKEGVLNLVRDRVGEKPLYYGWQGKEFLFGSELKALKAHPSFLGEVDRNSLALFLRHNYIPAPYSIYKGVSKLMPGELLKLKMGADGVAVIIEKKKYWSLNHIVEKYQSNLFLGSEADAVNLLEDKLLSSIGKQMLSDVPLGAFLSGGVDSSTIVALMQAQADIPVRTFTIGFEHGGYDEAVFAKSVARHLGTEHTEIYISPSDALNIIPSLPSIYCEPFSDSSQIPTYLVSHIARKHVTVALSGDGGDELFGGYNRYLSAKKIWERMQYLPISVRNTIAKILKSVPPNRWDYIYDVIKPLVPVSLRLSTPGDKIQKFSDILSLSNEQEFFQRLTSQWLDPASLVIDSREPSTLLTDSSSWPQTDSFEHFMMAMDAQTYLPDDILVKVDRAAMAASLETRTPLLDHGLIEFAWSLPLHLKIREGKGKWILREVLYKYVPKALIERPKQGFGVPLDSWLRGPLRDWAENLLDSSKLEREGYFRPAPIRKMWVEHLNGQRNWQHHLWTILMFECWLEGQ